MASSSSSSSRSWKYDVFLSFRGEDTRKTFVDHLYYALQRHGILTYKDDETLPRGDTIGPSLMNAIADSQIALIIFSQNYADSSWCLDELEYIMKCNKERGKIVMPIFYDVEPSEVRKQKQKYEDAFAKHELENSNKIESWRKALVEASNIAGWGTKHIANGHEAKGMEDIIGTILDKLLSSNSVVDENLVGMGTRLQDLKSQLQIGSGGVRMVGIWGIGGGGKTTLATSLYIEMSSEFDSCCFLSNIKEQASKPNGMETLQEKVLSDVFDKKMVVSSVDIGKHMIKKMIRRRKLLFVLDDVDDCTQLEALVGSRDWFGDGSRIIITTRNEHLLRAHKVDHVSHVTLLSHVEAIRLFNKHAYNDNNLVEDYEILSHDVVSYAGGLPLALKVLGTFLCDKDKDEWISTLKRLKDNPEMKIVEKLKISYDGLTPLEKQLFLDIACFFYRGMKKDKAVVMLEACVLHPKIGVKVLIQKALITISSVEYGHGRRDVFDMHDLIQEMGRYIVRLEAFNNPKKHSMVWRSKEIQDKAKISERSMASSSSYPSSPTVPASSSLTWKYDVFLSFRGEDKCKTFVDHLYSALQQRLIRTYKEDETLPRGVTISPPLLNAIDDSQIALVIFSENYANSSRCLDELANIMKCNKEKGIIVMPIFYYVDPTDVRNQKGKYGEAFSKHESESNNKVESWRKALVDASNISGWKTNHIVKGHDAKAIKDIVGTILDNLLYLNSVVDENLVGMGTRMQDLKSKLKIGSGGVQMVGIRGIVGSGKTTLAGSLFMEICGEFDSCCFVEDIRECSGELGMKTLQEKILSTVLKINMRVYSVAQGKQMIKRTLGSRNVLLVLDDIDDSKQLESLAGSHDWFGDGSRIIITSDDEHLLRAHRVDEVYHVSLLSDEEAIRLFNRHAYNKDNPIEHDEMLSQRVVSYAAGLPLALKVLGTVLCGKDRDEWISTLKRLKDIPDMKIVEKLKIRYDGLGTLEKELFLDIACFCRGMKIDKAMEMLDARGFHPAIGVKVLMQKDFITINSDGEFDMHDLIQEMGHYIVRGEYNNPKKHSRLWRDKDIQDILKNMSKWNTTMENNKIEALVCHRCPSSFGKLVSKAKRLRLLSVATFDEGDIEAPEYLSNELQYMYWKRYPACPFPESFQLRKLVVLRLKDSLQEELWSGCKYLPRLKVLHLSSSNLARTPDFHGLPCLEKLTLSGCSSLEEIHSSLGNHTRLVYVKVKRCKKLREFPTIVQMRNLESLEIYFCNALCKFPKIESKMDRLVNLSLYHVGIEVLPSSVGEYCTKLRSLILYNCSKLKSIEGNFHALPDLRECKIRGDYREVIKVPKDLFHENIL